MAQGILNYRKFHYLWLSLGMSAAATALYLTQAFDDAQPPNGGTWQGYTLGTIGALIIVWLSFLGVRKRRYRSRMGSVLGWTSAHIYLGASLLIIVTLHCAMQFGLNVHTIAYALMVLVVLSGIYGAYVYVNLPRVIASNSANRDSGLWIGDLAELDRSILRLSTRGDATLQARVGSAVELTRIGGGTWDCLLARDRSLLNLDSGRTVSNRDQMAIINTLAGGVPVASRRREAELLNDLLDAFGRRQVILRRLTRDVRLNALLRIWLFIHVPTTFALLAALTVHVASVFMYW